MKLNELARGSKEIISKEELEQKLADKATPTKKGK
jgi:hypothetical protein